MMNEVFVVFYDERYTGVGERGTDQRKIEGVFSTAEQARAKVRDLAKYAHIVYADFDVFEIQ